MKWIYEEPTIKVLRLENVDIVVLSSDWVESNDPKEDESFDSVLGGL